eukprot:763549-Hanusia_phi.AAC.2
MNFQGHNHLHRHRHPAAAGPVAFSFAPLAARPPRSLARSPISLGRTHTVAPSWSDRIRRLASARPPGHCQPGECLDRTRYYSSHFKRPGRVAAAVTCFRVRVLTRPVLTQPVQQCQTARRAYRGPTLMY